MTLQAILVVVVGLAGIACDGAQVRGSSPDRPIPQASGGTMSAVSRSRAIAVATESLVDLGKDPARYDMTVSEADLEWQVKFAGKQPRAPGDEITFFINKGTGAVRHLLGE